MHISPLHDWDVSPSQAIQIQRELAQKLQAVPLNFGTLRTVAGVDVSVKDGVSQAAVVVLSYPQFSVLERVTASQPTPFPYVPGLLTFREAPVLLAALEKLVHEVDVFMFDGMGQIHPRRMGIAAHMGLWLGKPTLGIGKTHFIGEFRPTASLAGSYSLLYDGGEVIGAVLRTRTNVKPVYVSAGHLMDLNGALLLAQSCSPKYRLPIPIREAHITAGIHEPE